MSIGRPSDAFRVVQANGHCFKFCKTHCHLFGPRLPDRRGFPTGSGSFADDDLVSSTTRGASLKPGIAKPRTGNAGCSDEIGAAPYLFVDASEGSEKCSPLVGPMLEPVDRSALQATNVAIAREARRKYSVRCRQGPTTLRRFPGKGDDDLRDHCKPVRLQLTAALPRNRSLAR